MAQKYVVKKDDNLLKVAQKTGVSPSAIQRTNGIRTLTAGQTIKVPTNFSDERGWDGTPIKTLSARERDLQAGAANQGNLTTAQTNGYGGALQNIYGAIGSMFGAQGQNNIAPTGSFLAGGGQTALAVQQPTFGPPRPISSSFISGAGQVNRNVPPPQYSGYSPDKFSPVPQTRLLSGSFYSGGGEVNLTGVSSTQQAAGGGNGNGGANSGGGYNKYGNYQYAEAPRPPTGFYTGDPNDPNTAAWRAYWNYSAQHPETVQSVIPNNAPTQRELIIKRRRAEGWETDSSYSPYSPTFQPIDPNFYGNNVNTALSWRVG